MTNSQKTSDPVRLEPAERTEPATCETHGAYQARIYAVLPDSPPIRLGCPKCAEIRRAEEAAATEKARREEEDHQLRVRIGRIGIPERFADRTFDNYAAMGDGQARALDVAKRFAESDKRGQSLILCGKPGTGKTHLACAIARRFAERGRSACFMTVLSAVRHVKSTYRHDSDKTEQDAICDLVSPSLLILDEVGVQVGSDHEKMILFEVINERYQSLRSTILISNLTRDELSTYLGDRIMDRFREAGGVIAFDWQSFRGQRAA